MNHIPTPETDAAWVAYQMDPTCDEGEPWGLSARLEQRLTIAREALKSASLEFQYFIDLGAPLSVHASCDNGIIAIAEALELTKPKL